MKTKGYVSELNERDLVIFLIKINIFFIISMLISWW